MGQTGRHDGRLPQRISTSNEYLIERLEQYRLTHKYSSLTRTLDAVLHEWAGMTKAADSSVLR